MFIRCSILVIKSLRGGANTHSAHLQIDPQPLGLRTEVEQVLLLETFVDPQIRAENRVNLDLGAVIQELRGIPSKSTDREIVETELDIALLDGGCSGGVGGVNHLSQEHGSSRGGQTQRKIAAVAGISQIEHKTLQGGSAVKSMV